MGIRPLGGREWRGKEKGEGQGERGGARRKEEGQGERGGIRRKEEGQRGEGEGEGVQGGVKEGRDIQPLCPPTLTHTHTHLVPPPSTERILIPRPGTMGACPRRLKASLACCSTSACPQSCSSSNVGTRPTFQASPDASGVFCSRTTSCRNRSSWCRVALFRLNWTSDFSNVSIASNVAWFRLEVESTKVCDDTDLCV